LHPALKHFSERVAAKNYIQLVGELAHNRTHHNIDIKKADQWLMSLVI